MPDAVLAVVVDDRGGLVVVGAKALLQSLGVVVAALNKGLAGDVILHRLLGGVEGCVVGSAGGRVDQSAGNAGDKEGVVDLKLDSVLQVTLTLLEHGIEALSLGDGAGEAVENEAVAVKMLIRSPSRELCLNTNPP